MWGWILVGVAGVAGYIIYRRQKAASAATTASTTPTGAPVETAVPFPENAGISQKQYAQLLDQDAKLYEAIQDMQGEESKEVKEDKDEGEDNDRDDRVKVPRVTGESYQQAARRVKAAGLKPSREGSGRVVQERPPAGREVKRGSEVVLFGRNK